MSNHCTNVGKVAAYTVYNVGAAFITGLVRTIIAIAYIAKHAIFARAYEAAASKESVQIRNQNLDNKVERNKENNRAERTTKNSKGFKKIGALLSEKATKLKNGIKKFR